ncbi:MAG: hypothetical protein ABIR80_20975 [Opitutaceae bacterium]
MIDPRLFIDGDLSFSVDGPSGHSDGRVEASGSHITVHASDAFAAMDAAVGGRHGRSPIPATIADLLADAGLTVEVLSPRGPVVTLGAGIESGLGKVLTGSAHVRLESAREARPFVRARVSAAVPSRRALAWGAGIVALAVAARSALSRVPGHRRR